MANVYPPSPALSACDSLADSDDLDALLEAQGKLSHWPTPPSVDITSRKDEKAVTVRTESVFSENDDDEDIDDELWRLAAAFTEAVTGLSGLTIYDIEVVARTLLRAEVPLGILGFAYNIIRVVGSSPGSLHENEHLVPDLAVTACLSLATMFMEDKAPSAKYWTHFVCKGSWPARVIDETAVELLLHPDLSMHALSSEDEVENALERLREVARGPQAEDEEEDDGDASAPVVEGPSLISHEAANPLKLVTSSTAQWVHGQVTPAETPVVEKNSFLRLL